jgi:serpin B
MGSMNAGVRLAAGAGIALALLLPPPASAQNDDQALTGAYNASGAALFRQLSGGAGNIVLSPLSIGTAMAMALSGARGETDREMAGVLQQRLERPAMEAANAALRAGLAVYDKSAVAPRCPQGMQAVAPGRPLVPRHRGFDRLIFGYSRMGKSLGATSSSMLRGTPG